MNISTEKDMQHIGETQGIENHDHDVIHELSNRLDALWRYDQYMANAIEEPELRDFWQKMKGQEQENIKQLKEFLAKHASRECFWAAKSRE